MDHKYTSDGRRYHTANPYLTPKDTFGQYPHNCKLCEEIPHYIVEYYQHEDYVSYRDHDVALLYVDGEVDADGVTVDFATLAETDAEDFVGSDCKIAGWGYDESKRIWSFFIQRRSYKLSFLFWSI